VPEVQADEQAKGEFGGEPVAEGQVNDQAARLQQAQSLQAQMQQAQLQRAQLQQAQPQQAQPPKPPDDCDKYMAETGCSWTAQFSCPGQLAGSDGTSSDDGTIGYVCCCARGHWKDSFPLQSSQSPPGFMRPSPSPGAGTPGSPVPSPPMHLPQGVPKSLATKLARKAKGGGWEAVAEKAKEQGVAGQRSPAQADERQDRQEKQLEPFSQISKSSSLRDFCAIAASLAVPIGSGLLPCSAGAFLLYQAMRKSRFIQVPQSPQNSDCRSGNIRTRSGRRY